jgi:hypothetical protein
MQSTAKTPEKYMETLTEERKQPMAKLRDTIRKKLPKGFEETMASGMINYVVPHKLYPEGYHCNPEHPLPFIAIASQKHFIAVYHMGLYAMPDLLKWFQSEFTKHSKNKLDMGKSCIRFKKMDQIPYELLGQLAAKLKPSDWIKTYESVMKK